MEKSARIPIFASVLPVILVATLIALYLWAPPTSHESPNLLLVLNISLTTLVSVFIAILAGRSFLLSGRPALLAICVGMLVWGVSAFVAVVSEQIGNYNITIHNLGVAASGICHFAGAFAALRYRERSLPAAGAWLSLGVAAGFCTVGAIWMSTQQSWLPPFFIEGVGGTVLRTFVLATSIGLFAAAAWLTWTRYRSSGWSFLAWYALGLALIAVGALGLILQPTHGSWLGWAARITQYVGGIYMLVGTIVTLREAGGWQFSMEERLQRSLQVLHDQGELIRHVNDNTSELIFMKDRAGRLTYANAATLRMLGKTSLVPDLADRDLFTDPNEHARIAANDRHVMETGQMIEAQELFTGADGRRRTFLTTKSPLRDDSGQIIGVISVSRDITERVVAEGELRRAKEAAEAASEALREADRRKDVFLATLAHELRNPLAPVRNAVKILQMKGPAVPELKWARDVIERQMQQMTRLIDDLMDVSRISRGKIELKRERVELTTVVQAALEASRPQIEQCGHELTVQLPAQPIQIDADITRLAQVLCNLLNNAAKYTERGGRIELEAHQQGNEVVVAVRDNGIGIPAEMLPRVFEMFTQVDDSLTKSHGGLGLGLTLVKFLVEMHGGEVEARSEGLGKGSKFLVRLPVLIEPTTVAAPGGRAPAQRISPCSHRILIVDDNRDAADTLATLLRIMGNEVRTAYDGFEGLRIGAEFRPDTCLLDIGLPKLNGYDVARSIKHEPWGKRVVLVAITGFGREEDRRRSKAAGFHDHLVKPVSPDAIAELIASLPTPSDVRLMNRSEAE